MIDLKNIPRSITLASAGFYCFRLITDTIHIIFLLSRGISLQDLTLLQILYQGSCLVVSYPLGLLTDRFDHKKLIHLSLILTALYYMLSLGAPHLILLCVAQIVLSVGITLADLNFSAWLAEQTKYKKSYILDYYAHLDEEIRAIGGMISSSVFCLITLNMTQKIIYEYIYLITIGLISSLHYLLKKLPNAQKKIKKPKQSHLIIPPLTFKNIFQSYSKILFLLISSLIWCAYQPLFYYWQPLLKQHNSSVISGMHNNIELVLGICFLAQNLMCFIFNEIAKRIASFKINFYLLGSCLAIGGTLCFWIIGSYTNHTVLCIIFYSFLQGLMSVLWRVTRNQCLKTNKSVILGRLLSWANICSSLTSMLFLASLTYIFDLSRLDKLFKYSAFILITIMIFFLNWHWINKRRQSA